jgi:hypothetical protein
VWRKARLSSLRDAVLRRLLGVETGERPTDELAARAQELREQFDRQYLESIQESEFLLVDFDVSFRLRRLFHLTYTCTDEAMLVALNRAIEFLEIARHAVEEALSQSTEARGTASPAEVWKLAFRRLTVLLRLDADNRPFPRSRPEDDAGAPLSPAELEGSNREFERRLRVLTAEAAPEGNNVFGISDRHELALVRAFGKSAEKDYLGFEALDAWLFPLEFVAGLHERDVIRVTRLSPVDARRGLCQRDHREKLCGDELAHFGAFLKRSWRANDILWGRLDGVCQLVETLAERGWLVETLATMQRRTILGCDGTTPTAERAERVAAWLRAHEIFPRAGETLRLAIAKKLAELLDVVLLDGRSEVDAKASLLAHLETAWSPLVDELVRAAHLDILHEDLPRVVEDAALEQMEWNQLATSNGKFVAPSGDEDTAVGFDARTFTFTANRQHFDPLLLALASRELSANALQKLDQGDDPTALEEYFRGYRVGSETITRGVPRVVLLELAGRAALVAQNCLVESLPEPEGVRRHWLFRLCLDWPLRVFDATARFLRHAPGARKPFVVASIFYIALAVVVNALWLKALYAVDGVQRQIALLLFVVGPLVCGLFSWLLVSPFRSARGEGSRASGWLFDLVVLTSSLTVTSKLLDADLEKPCSNAPFSAFGGECGTVVRALVLLVPVATGLVLGSRRRKARRREGNSRRRATRA